MKREIVQSSNLASVGYDAEQRVLEVAFKASTKTGHSVVWQYADVEPEIADQVVTARSIGGAFRSFIIVGRYAARHTATIDENGVESALEAESDVSA